MAVRIWKDLPDSERREDLPEWMGIVPDSFRCQAATKAGHRHRQRAPSVGLCFSCLQRADTATQARARALAAR